jgi:hypothetical protein
MFESGIELDDVLCTLRGKVDRWPYSENRTLASWSEHWFVLAVAATYGQRVMVPGRKKKVNALGKSA